MGISGKTVPRLTLWDDVIEGVAEPQTQRLSTAHLRGACGAKGLGKFVGTPVSEAIPKMATPRFPIPSDR